MAETLITQVVKEDLPVPLQSDLSSGHYSPKPSEKLLLPPVRPCDINKKCLVIDLDETLVHSSFKPVQNPDFIIPVDVDGVIHQVYVLRRPHVDEFLRRLGELFECVLFTASLAKYADPVADLLDKNGVFRARLFREACVFHKGNFVKDLNRLGRDLKRVIIVDNSPTSYTFHPDNAIPVQSWFDDMQDTELLELLPLLERLSKTDNVYTLLRNSNAPCHVTNQNCTSTSSSSANANALIMMSNGNSPITQMVATAAPPIGGGGFGQSGAPSNVFGQSGAPPIGAGGQSSSTLPGYPGNG